MEDAQSLSPGAYPPPEVTENRLPLVHAKPNIANHNELSSFIDGVVQAHMHADHIPGVAIAIVKDGISVLEKGYGTTGNGQAVHADKTVFRLGDISAIFTGVALMQLEEAGFISLDDPVNTRLPDQLSMPVHKTGPLLIRHLMTYKTGLESVGSEQFAYQDADALPSPKTALITLRPEQVRPAGLYTVPSRYGTALAGAIITAVTGRNFPGYVEDNIFTPLGMISSSFREPMNADLASIHDLPQPLSQTQAESWASGYQYDSGVLTPYPFFYYSPVAAALSLSSTAQDIARFMRAILNAGQLDDARILRLETMQKIYPPLSENTAPHLPAVRYGLLEYPLPGGITGIGHSGNLPGFISSLVMVPELGLGIFVATNSDSGKALVSALPGLLVAHFFPEDAPTQKQPNTSDGMKMDPDGTYFNLNRRFSDHHALGDALNARYALAYEKNDTLRVSHSQLTAKYVKTGPALYNQIIGDRIGLPQIGFLIAGDTPIVLMASPSGWTTLEKIGFFHKPLWLLIMAVAVSVTCLGLLVESWHRRSLPPAGALSLRFAHGLTPVLALVWLLSCGFLFVLFVAYTASSASLAQSWVSVFAWANLVTLILTLATLPGLLHIWKGSSIAPFRYKILYTGAIILMLWMLYTLSHWNLLGI